MKKPNTSIIDLGRPVIDPAEGFGSRISQVLFTEGRDGRLHANTVGALIFDGNDFGLDAIGTADLQRLGRIILAGGIERIR